MNIQIIMVLAYLIINLAISFIFTKQNKGTKAYFLAQGNLGVLLIFSLAFSENISAGTLVGAATTGFTTGFASGWATWGQSIGAIIFLIFVGKFYRIMGREKGAMTIAACYNYMFDTKSRIVMLCIAALNYSILFAVAPAAVANVCGPLFPMLSRTALIWIVGILFIVMTITGGLKGIAYMNTVNSAILYICMIILAVATVREAGGFGNMMDTLPATYFSPFTPDVGSTLGAGIGTGIGMLAASVFANATFSAESYRAAKRGIILVIIFGAAFAFLPSIVGIAAQVIMPEAEASTILYTISNHIHPVLGGLACMVTCAACFSSGPAFLLLVSSTCTKDLYCVVKPDATEQQQMRFSRLVSIIIGVIFIYFGSQSSSLLNTILGAFQIRSVVGFALIIAIFWKGMTKGAAFWSMLIGGIVAAVWYFLGNPNGIQPVWPAAIVTIGLALVISLIERKNYCGYDKYREMLARFPSVEEKDLAAAAARHAARGAETHK